MYRIAALVRFMAAYVVDSQLVTVRSQLSSSLSYMLTAQWQAAGAPRTQMFQKMKTVLSRFCSGIVALSLDFSDELFKSRYVSSDTNEDSVPFRSNKGCALLVRTLARWVMLCHTKWNKNLIKFI